MRTENKKTHQEKWAHNDREKEFRRHCRNLIIRYCRRSMPQTMMTQRTRADIGKHCWLYFSLRMSIDLNIVANKRRKRDDDKRIEQKRPKRNGKRAKSVEANERSEQAKRKAIDSKVKWENSIMHDVGEPWKGKRGWARKGKRVMVLQTNKMLPQIVWQHQSHIKSIAEEQQNEAATMTMTMKKKTSLCFVERSWKQNVWEQKRLIVFFLLFSVACRDAENRISFERYTFEIIIGQFLWILNIRLVF